MSAVPEKPWISPFESHRMAVEAYHQETALLKAKGWRCLGHWDDYAYPEGRWNSYWTTSRSDALRTLSEEEVKATGKGGA